MFQPGDLNTRVRVAQFENFGDGGYGGYTEETGGQGGKFVWCKWEPTGGEINKRMAEIFNMNQLQLYLEKTLFIP